MVFKYSQYGESRRKIGFVWEPKKYRPSRRRIMSRSTECRHKLIPEIENKMYPDYDHGSFQRMYIELKEEAEGDFTFLKADNSGSTERLRSQQLSP